MSMLARDYFESCVTYKQDLERAKARLDAAREGLDGLGHANGLSMSVSGGCSSDAGDKFLARINARDKALERFTETANKLEDKLLEAMSIIDKTGEDTNRHTGLWRSCLEYRYLQAMSIREVASNVGMSCSSVQIALRNALTWIDEHHLLDDIENV